MDIHQLCIVREPDLAQWFLKSCLPEGRWHSLLRLIIIPGFEEGIDGFSLAEKMEQGAERFGAETELAEVLSVDFSNDIKIVESSEGTFKAKTVIIATGAVPRELGVPGEKELVGRGVGYCATCDGMFYRNKTVMVVGGGNTAAADAMTLSRNL